MYMCIYICICIYMYIFICVCVCVCIIHVFRVAQLQAWLVERPHVFWISGLFNPQGFIAAMKQETCRNPKNSKWSIDQLQLKTDV